MKIIILTWLISVSFPFSKSVQIPQPKAFFNMQQATEFIDNYKCRYDTAFNDFYRYDCSQFCIDSTIIKIAPKE